MQCKKCQTYVPKLDAYPGELCFACFVVKDAHPNTKPDSDGGDFIANHVQVIGVTI